MGVQGQDLCSEVLRFVGDFVRDNGYAPTYDEIRASVGLSSKSHVKYYLAVLEGEGLIERTPHAPRSLRLVRPPAGTIRASAR